MLRSTAPNMFGIVEFVKWIAAVNTGTFLQSLVGQAIGGCISLRKVPFLSIFDAYRPRCSGMD
jgi:hypothetical protein